MQGVRDLLEGMAVARGDRGDLRRVVERRVVQMEPPVARPVEGVTLQRVVVPSLSQARPERHERASGASVRGGRAVVAHLLFIGLEEEGTRRCTQLSHQLGWHTVADDTSESDFAKRGVPAVRRAVQHGGVGGGFICERRDVYVSSSGRHCAAPQVSRGEEERLMLRFSFLYLLIYCQTSLLRNHSTLFIYFTAH